MSFHNWIHKARSPLLDLLMEMGIITTRLMLLMAICTIPVILFGLLCSGCV